LSNALLEVRPDETIPGAANEIFERYYQKLLKCLADPQSTGWLSLPGALAEVASGRLFGFAALLKAAAREFEAARIPQARPTVLVVGEIYVRLDPFANDHILEKLEQRGLRARLAPLSEWLEYCAGLQEAAAGGRFLSQWFSGRVQRRIQDELYRAVAGPLGWHARLPAADYVAAARDYLRPELQGEAVLTLGGALAEWRAGRIAGVLSIGPLECMPNKIAEAQFCHAAEQEQLVSLTLPCNGEPADHAALDTFAFEVKQRWERAADLQSAVPPIFNRQG
jgi:predicted nucleotide-binding protein (sugar kinase/HSP70/actin superfamily)